MKWIRICLWLFYEKVELEVGGVGHGWWGVLKNGFGGWILRFLESENGILVSSWWIKFCRGRCLAL